MITCKICSANASFFAQASLMKYHAVKYFRCDVCGFLQTEEPYWLDDAYSDAITGSDLGLVGRNLHLALIAQSVIKVCFNPGDRFLDYGGGYGLMVRLMRDAGYDFYWYDKYCDNLFAQGFAATSGDCGKYELVTAFEMLEHMLNPLDEIVKLLSYSRNVLFTTEILPCSRPLPENWYYYGLDHGQHISFFTIESLKIIAQKNSLNFYTNGTSIHLLTEKKLSPLLFRLASRYRFASLATLVFRRKPLLTSDYAALNHKHGKDES